MPQCVVPPCETEQARDLAHRLMAGLILLLDIPSQPIAGYEAWWKLGQQRARELINEARDAL